MKTRIVLLAKRIREARLSAGLSQADIAKRIGKSKQLASAWEAGRAEMTATTLGDFARIASADANWLLHGVSHATGSPGSPVLPQGCALPMLSDAEAIKHARGKLELGSAANRIYCSFPAGPKAFAVAPADHAMAPRLPPGCVVVVDPDRPIAPGSVVAAVVKEADTPLDRPLLAIRHIHFRSASLGSAPYDLVPANPAWPNLSIRKAGHAILLGPISMICKREGHAAPR